MKSIRTVGELVDYLSTKPVSSTKHYTCNLTWYNGDLDADYMNIIFNAARTNIGYHVYFLEILGSSIDISEAYISAASAANACIGWIE